jgi:hypothetical protein
MALFEPIFDALNRSQIRYVVVGGLATVLHGHARLTVDVDLIVDLAPAAARRAIDALTAIGLCPRIPVRAEEFADPDTRAAWVRDKHMQVFPLADPAEPLRQVDLFVETPIDFESLWRRSEVIQLDHTTVRVASIQDLITLKRLAGRTQDLADIEALEAILAKRSG